jgi:phytoene dehydrogenase-like protein
MVRTFEKAQVELPSDHEVRVMRSFKAPRELVFKAYTTPSLLQRWLGGHPGWTMPVCEMDVRVGGSYRWRWRSEEDGKEFGFHGTFEEVDEAETGTYQGRMAERPFVLVGQQYLADPGRSNGNRHPIWAYAHVPAGYDGDASGLIEDQIERFAPGFRERIVARHARSTADFARHNANYVGGDVVTGLNSARQLLFRPRVTLDPYYLGARGMYICSAATPPGAGAHGMCGYNAAKSALRRLDPATDLKRNEAHD